MKYSKLAMNDNEYVAAQNNDVTTPLIVGKANSNNIYHMSDKYINRILDLDNVEGVPTTETNYIEQIDDILSVYEQR